jgi:hypothetical protein
VPSFSSRRVIQTSTAVQLYGQTRRLSVI